MKKFFVANWKMYLTYKQEVNYIKENLKELSEISQQNNIVLCPSFLSLNEIQNLIKNSKINLGAQNCSDKELGAFTGEISAQSLNQLGCKFCIIGHSEIRENFNENNKTIADKVKILLKNNIIPILCIGESEKENKKNETEKIITQQLGWIIKIENYDKILIAYEPIWSIGTGQLPTIQFLDKTIQIVKKILKKNSRVLYGGSVNGTNIHEFKQSKEISGFLIGKASIDFQEFKKIVKSYKD